MFDIIFDFATISLLIVTIVYSWQLNKKLAVITNQKSEIATNLETFSNATDTAVVAVEELHVKGEEICKIIDQKIRKAQFMADEIDFLTSRVNKKVAEIKNIRPVANEQKQSASSLTESEILKMLKNNEFKQAMVN